MKKIMEVALVAVAMFLVFFVSSKNSSAAPDPVIYYQGKLTNTADVAVGNGNFDFVFTIWDAASGGSCLWSARGACGSPTAKSIPLALGIFNTQLGESGDNALNLNFNSNYWLEIQVGSDSPMTPRKKINAVGYAINSNRLNGETSNYYLDTSATAQTKLGDLEVQGDLKTSLGLSILESGSSPAYYTTFQGGDQTGDITYTLPTSSINGVLKNTAGVLSWDSANYLSLGSTSVNIDSTANSSIWVNDTGGGNLLELEAGGVDKFVVSNAGAVTGGTYNSATLSGGSLSSTTVNGVTTANILLSTGSYSNPTWLTSVSGGIVSGNISGNAANVTGIVAAINGGTGLSTYAVGDILYANTTSSLARLADVAVGSVLISGGVGAAPSWGALSTIDHGSLGGLTDDDHTQYAFLAGRSGGQELVGGTAANNILTLQGNSATGNTAGNDSIVFKVGDSGNTIALSLLNSGGLDFHSNEAKNFRVENTDGSVLTPTCDSANQGRMYYDTNADAAFVCIETAPGVYGWFDYTSTTVQSNKVVTVGTGGDYATISAAAAYLNTLGGGMILLTPETHNVTSSIDLSNISLIGANTGDTRINITGSGVLRVKETQFKSMTIYIDAAIAGTSGLDAKYSAATTSSIIFEWVDFITNGTKVLINSSESTKPTIRTRFISTSTTSGTRKIFLTKTASNLNTASTHFVESQGGSGFLDMEDWDVKIAGSSNVKTSGIVTTIPDSTIFIYPGMNLQGAINSLSSGGVITLLPGVHTLSSTLLINKDDIQIEGYGDASIVRASGFTGGATVAAIQIGAANGATPNDRVVIRDFKVEVSGTGASDISGIRVAGGEDDQIVNVTVVKTAGASGTGAGARMGIMMIDGTAEKLVRPVVKGSRVLGTSSVVAYFTDGIHITGGAAYQAGSGIFTNGQGVDGALVDGNYVDYVRETVAVFVGVNNSSLYNNRFSRMGAGGGGALGIFFGNSSNVNMTANVVATSLSSASTGIAIDMFDSGSLKQVTDSVFTANTVDGAANGGVGFQLGVNIGNANNTGFHRNLFTNNVLNGASNLVTTALTITGNADDNNITNNIINGNANAWDTGINLANNTADRNFIGKNAFMNTTIKVADLGIATQLDASQHNAAANPTVTDDNVAGYVVGTVWVNTTAQSAYIATNVATGAAVWKQIDNTAGGSGDLDTAYTNDADKTMNINNVAGLVFASSSAGNIAFNLQSTGDFVLRDNGVTFLTIDDLGGFDYTLDATDNPSMVINNLGTGSFRINDQAGDTTPFIVDQYGNVGIGVAAPSALLNLSAGTLTAGTAPLKFTAGVNLTAPEAGAMEWDGTNLFITQAGGPTRKTLAYSDGNITGTSANVTGTVSVSNGGTGVTATPTNGQILIGNGTGYTLSTLTQGTGIGITNGSGSITINNAGTLKNAYDNDTDGGNANVLMTSTDGSIVFQDVAGTQFQVTMNAATAPTIDMMNISNNGASQGTSTAGVDGLQIDFVNAGATVINNAGLRVNMTSANNTAGTTLEGIMIENIIGQANATETALQIGTGWDAGISIASGGMTINSGALAINNSNGITSNQATMIINASGTVDVQDVLNADSITTDIGGVTIAAGQAYTGAGAVGLSSAIGTGLTIDSGSTGTITIGGDGSAETINIGTGAAAKTLVFGSTNSTSITTIQSGSGGISFQSNGTGTGNVQIGDGGASSATPDLLVMDIGSAEPVGTNGAMYYSTALNKFRCYENSAWKDCDTTSAGAGYATIQDEGTGLTQRSALNFVGDGVTCADSGGVTTCTIRQATSGAVAFTDTTPAAIADNNTTELFNNVPRPNITPISTTQKILITVHDRFTGGGNADTDAAVQIYRNIGTNPTCAGGGANTLVGDSFSAFMTNGTDIGDATATFLDSPATTSNVVYTVCSSSNSVLGSAPTNNRIDVTLVPLGADVAENYYTKDDSIEEGDIVSMDSSIQAGVRKSSLAYDRQTVGVVSTVPGLLLQDELGMGNEGRPVPVALAGRIPVKVSAENGRVKVGDYLTSSSVPGVAMKATKAGPVIGQAIQNFNYADDAIGLVIAFVKNSYFNGEALVDDTGIALTGTDLLQKFMSGKLETASDVAVSNVVADRVAVGLEIVAPQIIADSIIARTIKAESIEGLEFIETSIQANAAGLESNGEGVQNLGLELKKIRTQVQEIALQLGANTIKTLEIQGALIVSGPTEFKGKTLFSSIAEFIDKVIFRKNVEFEGTATFNQDTAGYAKIKEGTRSVKISFEQEYAQAPIVNVSVYLQHIEDKDLREATEELLLASDVKFIITNVFTSGFEIKIDRDADADVPFSWQAIAVKDAKMFESQPAMNGEISNDVSQIIEPSDIDMAASDSTVLNVPFEENPASSAPDAVAGGETMAGELIFGSPAESDTLAADD